VSAAKRRIALFAAGFVPLGGAETQLLRLARGLRARGWEVAVVSVLPGPDGDLERGLEADGIPFVTLGVRGPLGGASGGARLYRFLRSWRPDVLACFMFHANVIGRVMGRMARVPVVVSSVRTDNFGPPWRYRLVAATDRLADVTTTNSRHVAEDLVRRGTTAPDRVRVIPNGIDVSLSNTSPEERAALRGELGVEEGEFLWLALGHLEPRKDYPTLLHALGRLGAGQGRWKVRIVGRGRAEDELRALAASLGLADRVELLGHRPDAARLLPAADGFVMSSVWEGTPNALMEALLAGVPAVGTAVGGIPELIQDGVSGFLVPPSAPDAIAAAMGRLMALSAEDRRRMGAAGRTYVAGSYRLDEVVDRWEGLFLELLAGRRSGVARAVKEPAAPARTSRLSAE
jgi:glycosyltransferase involved in cell wall biosynthesis